MTVCLSLYRTRLINGLMIFSSYPLDRRAFWTLWICWRKFTLSVFVLRALYDSPSAILFPTPPGWNDDAWTYACVLVGFVYVLMSSVCLV